MNKKPLKIAIDGPVGSGKGTLAMALAERLNALYVYTGGMYRELTLACLRENINVHNEKMVLEILQKITIELRPIVHKIRAFLNNENVSDDIFKPEVNKNVPIISAFPGVRKEMVYRQKRLAEEKIAKGIDVVMEGRDITTDVLPDADIKIYLTADINTRAERRLRQLEERGIKTTLEEVLREIEERDRMDTERQASPLRVVSDAYVLDTTNLTIEETVDKVMEKLEEKGLV